MAQVIFSSAVVEMEAPYTPLSPGSLKPLHPFCNVCGWRKGGIHSWDGRACKCRLSELPMVLDAALE